MTSATLSAVRVFPTPGGATEGHDDTAAFPLDDIVKTVEMLRVGISKCKDQLLEILLCMRQYQ